MRFLFCLAFLGQFLVILLAERLISDNLHAEQLGDSLLLLRFDVCGFVVGGSAGHSRRFFAGWPTATSELLLHLRDIRKSIAVGSAHQDVLRYLVLNFFNIVAKTVNTSLVVAKTQCLLGKVVREWKCKKDEHAFFHHLPLAGIH